MRRTLCGSPTTGPRVAAGGLKSWKRFFCATGYSTSGFARKSSSRRRQRRHPAVSSIGDHVEYRPRMGGAAGDICQCQAPEHGRFQRPTQSHTGRHRASGRLARRQSGARLFVGYRLPRPFTFPRHHRDTIPDSDSIVIAAGLGEGFSAMDAKCGASDLTGEIELAQMLLPPL